MKISKYNYYVKDGKDCFWFNGITQFFLKSDVDLSKKLENNLINNIEGVKNSIPALYEKLIMKGFVIEDNVEEVDLIRELNDKVSNSKNYFLIILPTLNCNFNCWYCVQDHVETKMDQITFSNIKKHIKKMVIEEKIESLHIEWFGGEPFLFFDEIVKPLSIYALNLCKKHELPFRNTATTNGYLLNKTSAISLEKLGFKHFQISIDGTRIQHNKVKNSKDGNSAFDVTLENINFILSNSNNIQITLRLNYSNKNLKESIIKEVNGLIEEKNRTKIKVVFRRIWQEKADETRGEKITEMINSFEESGYCTSRWDLDNGFIPSYADKKYYNAINYNGNVLKCTANDDLQHNNPPGKLENDGNIAWEDGVLDKI